MSRRYAVVQHHVSDGYETPWGDDRATFYGGLADGIPWFAYDGLFDAWPIDNYEPALLSRQAITTTVTMDISALRVYGDTYEVSTDVCVEAGGATESMTVHTVQVLDKYPDDSSYYRNCFRQAAANEDVMVNPGECTVVTRTITVDPVSASRSDDIAFIAWAQTPATSYPAEVFQSAQTTEPVPWSEWIFPSAFESGDFSDWDNVAP